MDWTEDEQDQDTTRWDEAGGLLDTLSTEAIKRQYAASALDARESERYEYASWADR